MEVLELGEEDTAAESAESHSLDSAPQFEAAVAVQEVPQSAAVNCSHWKKNGHLPGSCLLAASAAAAEERIDVEGLEMGLAAFAAVSTPPVWAEQVVVALEAWESCILGSLQQQEVPWQRRREALGESRRWRISSTVSRLRIRPGSSTSTYIPVLCPTAQIRMVDPSIRAHMLSRAHRHVLARCHVDQRRLSGVCVWHPQGNREAVDGAAKLDRYRAAEEEEQGGRAIFVG